MVVGTAADRSDLWPMLGALHPDVLVLGQPERSHATEMCRQVRVQHSACRVVLYSSAPIALPAVLAGAHALVDKAEDLATLVDAIWIRGERRSHAAPADAGVAAGGREAADLR